MHDTTWDAIEAASAGLVDADDMLPRLFADPDLRWMDEGVCAQADPEVWFPERFDKWSAQAAKAVCARCPVVDVCLEYALENGEIYGVWGGTSERERRAMRAGRRAGVAA